MSKIFISGVAGFLGSHLADAFLAEGHEVVGVDNLIGGYIDNVPEGVRFHLLDCNAFEALKHLMKGVDIVYHCAATAYEGLSVFSPHVITQNVVGATTGMISAACENRVKRFVLCSSMARYGGSAQDAPFREDLPCKPQDPYGIGKLASEHLLQNLAETHGMDWVIAVPHNIIGPRQKYDDPYRNVASIFINRMLRGEPPYLYGDGSQVRCFSFISDVVRPLEQMALDPACSKQVINIGPDDHPVSIRFLANTLAHLLSFPMSPVCTKERPNEVHVATCSADKARRLLGYNPQVTLEDGLRSMISWIRQRGPRHFTYHLDLEIVNDRLPDTWAKRLF